MVGVACLVNATAQYIDRLDDVVQPGYRDCLLALVPNRLCHTTRVVHVVASGLVSLPGVCLPGHTLRSLD